MKIQNTLFKPAADNLRISDPMLLSIILLLAFSLIALQITLFQTLNIFATYLQATGIIATALVGITLGAIIGWSQLDKHPYQTCLMACYITPFTMLLSLTSVMNNHEHLFTQIALVLPFISISTIMTIALAKRKAHVYYCFDLIGAALGALAINSLFIYFREEGTILVLAIISIMISFVILYFNPNKRQALIMQLLSLIILGLFTSFLYLQQHQDILNVVRTKVLRAYPKAKMILSSASFVGRYDVIRRDPEHSSLAAYNNGRIIDTIRNRPVSGYAIDPRIPYNLYDNPKILILGLSGDGISKTARYNSNQIYGIEINPIVIDLQRTILKPYNANSYEGINVFAMDGRSFVEQQPMSFDMITLMNAHSSRGHVTGRAASPEYLHTYEAMVAYLKHLTDRGIINIEEPIAIPLREVPVWKMVNTMKKALVSQGITEPHKHFFVFQWKTKTNNYIQVLMKKTPFSENEIIRLKKWLVAVDTRHSIQKKVGKTLGPITTKTTVLYDPFIKYDTNYAHILENRADADFMQSHHLTPTTDDMPFHFDIDPAHRTVQASYHRLLLLLMITLPFLGYLLRKKDLIHIDFSLLLLCSGLTGLAYLLIEVIAIQWFAIFLGTPVITFATVLGTLLISSGIGSFYSSKLSLQKILCCLLVLMILLAIYSYALPMIFSAAMLYGLKIKLAISAAILISLGFFMGMAFPFCLNYSKQILHYNAAAILFSINGALSALAVPLALYFSTSWGYRVTFHLAILIYGGCALLLFSLFQKRQQTATAITVGVLLISLLLAPDALNSKPLAAAKSSPRYNVYNITYGKSKVVERKYVVYGLKKRRKISWHFWLIQDPKMDRNILVDTGFKSRSRIKKWRFYDYQPPAKLLASINLDPNHISDIILTHAHWDHAGLVDDYPHARIWMQAKEFKAISHAFANDKKSKAGYRYSDYQALLAIQKDNRLKLIDDNYTLYPGLSMHFEGTHTAGSQYIKVATHDGPVILAGDSDFLYKNHYWHFPIRQTHDRKANLEILRRYHREAGSTFLIIPGHDRKSRVKFPRITKYISKITMIEQPESKR